MTPDDEARTEQTIKEIIINIKIAKGNCPCDGTSNPGCKVCNDLREAEYALKETLLPGIIHTLDRVDALTKEMGEEEDKRGTAEAKVDSLECEVEHLRADKRELLEFAKKDHEFRRVAETCHPDCQTAALIRRMEAK